ncbi:spore coat U domain-containing protein [Sphingobium sp.]|uniref:Csu type fimbrial protein n=1 Tax=Sphingobium sp. TaxID=1912891 RepID=UPI0028BEB453|nr:spore coat U domain-containing protein [Sphingobium sp.]
MILRASAAALVDLLLCSPAAACTLCSCTASASGVSFGSYDPGSASPSDASGTVTLNCTGAVSLMGTIDVAASPGTSGDALARQMAQGPDRLSYNLYTDSSRTSIWGTGAGGTSTLTATLNGLLLFSQSVTVYGRLPAHQWVRTGAYADSVIVTVTY